MDLGQAYLERVYAGVLGKIIGVYLGRPFEQWSREAIEAKFGDIEYYVHEKQGHRLIVADDDITGTFTFLRALEDHGFDPNLTSQQIGETWMNYLIENRTILWWGGMGNSTEHTAYLRMKAGIPAPESGSIALNGHTVAEQIGAQIFIDGWGLICPRDPEKAVDFAARAARISHDGEAVYGAQMVAAMVAQGFAEPDIRKLIHTALSLIPADSLLAGMVRQMIEWRDTLPDWRDAQVRLVEKFGYEKFGGGCHMIPNHAVVQLGLLYGDGDFSRSLMVANTAGYDTDCNSGNVGCILGVARGLAGIESGPDWRGPVADRLFLPTADGGRCVTDAARESLSIANAARKLQGLAPLSPKAGARFSFTLPGSVHGFLPSEEIEAKGVATVRQVPGPEGTGALEVQWTCLATGRVARIATATFPPAADRGGGGYGLFASPTIVPGQTLKARVLAGSGQGTICLFARGERPDGTPAVFRSEPAELGQPMIELNLLLTDRSAVIEEVGLEVLSAERSEGTLYLDYLDWSGTPDLSFPEDKGNLRREQWVNASDERWRRPYQVISNGGLAKEITGSREWMDYQVVASCTPFMAKRFGIQAYVQGMTRWYGLLLEDGKAKLVRSLHQETVLAEMDCPTCLGTEVHLSLQVVQGRITARIDGEVAFQVEDSSLDGGGIAMAAELGRVTFRDIEVLPA